jgi:hypothetical protein|tara:strand:+ start:2687 stop:2986 length:300 start_codon:yes stop_codon:yes gene_type:complete
MNRLLITVMMLVLSQGTLAGDDYYYQCSKDERLKYIAVTYDSSTSNVPCSVMFSKKVKPVELWHADIQVGYCESKASNFAENQTIKGWSCTKNMGAAPK